MCECKQLEDLVFVGNPLEEQYNVNGTYRAEVTKRLLKLKKLDGFPVIRDEVEEDEDDVKSTLDMDEIEDMTRGDEGDDEEEPATEAPTPADMVEAEVEA